MSSPHYETPDLHPISSSKLASLSYCQEVKDIYSLSVLITIPRNTTEVNNCHLKGDNGGRFPSLPQDPNCHHFWKMTVVTVFKAFAGPTSILALEWFFLNSKLTPLQMLRSGFQLLQIPSNFLSTASNALPSSQPYLLLLPTLISILNESACSPRRSMLSLISGLLFTVSHLPGANPILLPPSFGRRHHFFRTPPGCLMTQQ